MIVLVVYNNGFIVARLSFAPASYLSCISSILRFRPPRDNMFRMAPSGSREETELTPSPLADLPSTWVSRVFHHYNNTHSLLGAVLCSLLKTMDHTLRCNSLKCRERLIQEAVVTTCRRVSTGAALLAHY